MEKGRNLPGFVASLLEFAAHIRNPAVNDLPSGIEARRMKIYTDLFYNNIEGFLANAFPVCKRILTAPGWDGIAWHPLVRQFVHRHGSASPYFMEIPQEFLEFVSDGSHEPLPDWFLELAHYEWVEMALAVADEEVPPAVEVALPLRGVVRLNPLIWPLSYRYAVHEIGPTHLPAEVPPAPSHLIVYRRRDDQVRFLTTNALTQALVGALAEGETVEAACAALARQAERPLDDVLAQADAALARLLECEIVLGMEAKESAQ